MKKIIFIHIPRTSGKSFFAAIRNHVPGPISLNPNWVAHIKDDRTPSYRFIGGHITPAIADYVGGDVDMITMLRDPIERVVSMYRHMCSHLSFETWRRDNPRAAASFYQFLSDPSVNWQARNVMCRYLGSDYGPKDVNPDSRYLIDHLEWSAANESDEEVGGRAIRMLDSLSFVGFKEEHARSVREFLGLSESHPVKEREHKNHSAGISQKELDLVKELNEYDVTLYNVARNMFRRIYAK